MRFNSMLCYLCNKNQGYIVYDDVHKICCNDCFHEKLKNNPEYDRLVSTLKNGLNRNNDKEFKLPDLTGKYFRGNINDQMEQ